MSPSEIMIRATHWVCARCGEMARSARPPRACVTCGCTGSQYEEQRNAALPSD